MSVSAYASHVSTRRPRKTPQAKAISANQVKNNAGGFVYEVDCWARLDRFLILGTQGGTFYAGERKLTRENAAAVIECATEDAYRCVERIREISLSGRAPKNDQAIFALALIAGELRGTFAARYALEAIQSVCRTGTMLFDFVRAVVELRGWGRSLRDGIAGWYTNKDAKDLAYQVTKYQQREGWSHRDLLRLSHPRSDSTALNAVFRWVCGGLPALHRDIMRHGAGDVLTGHYPSYSETMLPDIIRAFEEGKTVGSAKKIARLIREEGLVREHVPTEFLNSIEVWEALLEKMPPHAMLRNLGKMTNLGLLKPLSSASKHVCSVLTDPTALAKARLHPMSLLMAQKVYRQGKGDKGKLTWSPDGKIVAALDEGFHQAFQAVEPTGLRHLLALDVSGSMAMHPIAGTTLTPREASAAMAMVTARVEPEHHLVWFSNTGKRKCMHQGYSSGLSPLDLNPHGRLSDAIAEVSNKPFGGTDCALPMVYALENRLEVDVFVIYTDSETWAGNEHPSQALRAYRDRMGIDAKLVVCAMTSNGFSIADPNDRGMLDVVGFDTATPAIMADFAKE